MGQFKTFVTTQSFMQTAGLDQLCLICGTLSPFAVRKIDCLGNYFKAIVWKFLRIPEGMFCWQQHTLHLPLVVCHITLQHDIQDNKETHCALPEFFFLSCSAYWHEIEVAPYRPSTSVRIPPSAWSQLLEAWYWRLSNQFVFAGVRLCVAPVQQ